MLYVIGLGLSDEKDITVKGLEASPILWVVGEG
jgi:diphthamide biosynthesis methyltransferase